MSELQTYLDQCLVHAAHMRNLSTTYMKSVRYSCETFFEQAGVTTLAECTFPRIENWLINWGIEYRWAPATFRAHHRNIGFLFRYLKKRNVVETDPTVGIELPKLPQTLPKGLSAEQAEKLIDAAKRMKYMYRFEWTRNTALVALMLFTGLRRQEVANLRLEDVDVGTPGPGGRFADWDCGRMAVYVIQGKWRKDRVVPVSTRLAAILREYLAHRSMLGLRCPYFFVTAQKDLPLTANAIRLVLQRLRKAVGFHFSPHSLRHTFATLMLEGSCDLFTLSKLMGHTKITTTSIYLSASPRHLASSIERHPLN